ncbi:MAG: hypothetical protein GXP45_04700 [bacterium]|nr:hypothetical protein [bacterium]
MGLLAWFGIVVVLKTLGLGALSFFLLGVVPLILSFAIKSSHYLALALLCLVYLLNLIFSVWSFVVTKQDFPLIVLNVMLCGFFAVGFVAMKALKK